MNKMYPAFQLLLIALSISVALFSCSHKTNTNGATEPTPAGNSESSETHILFLSFKIYADSTAKAGEIIRLISIQKVKGHLKSKIKRPENLQTNDLICAFLDKNGAVLATERVEDPLTASVEYPDDHGTMNRASLKNKEADLFVRVQYHPQFYRLRISKAHLNGETLAIADFLIN